MQEIPPRKSNSLKQRKNYFLKIFKQFDLDSSGGVSKTQIIKVLQACEIEMDQSQAEDIINEIDADGGGQVQQDQFIAFLQRQQVADNYTEQQFKKLFGFFLQNGKTKIGFEEIKRMFQNLGQKVSDSDVSAMIIYADKDLDGQISFDEFCDVIKSL